MSVRSSGSPLKRSPPSPWLDLPGSLLSSLFSFLFLSSLLSPHLSLVEIWSLILRSFLDKHDFDTTTSFSATCPHFSRVSSLLVLSLGSPCDHSLTHSLPPSLPHHSLPLSPPPPSPLFLHFLLSSQVD